MKVFVFDLDFTLWNAGDTFCSETNPPYVWKEEKLYDQNERWIRLYPDTIQVLEYLKSREKTIAAASRTHRPEWANQLLDLFGIKRYFSHTEIYRGSKLKHLQNIQQHFNVNFSDIIFFDDEMRNINDASSLGVKSIHVKNGICWDEVLRLAND